LVLEACQRWRGRLVPAQPFHKGAEDFGLGLKATLRVGGSFTERPHGLILQLSLRTGFALMPLPVTVLGHGLMDAPPQ